MSKRVVGDSFDALGDALGEFHMKHGAWDTAKVMLGYLGGILLVAALRSNRVGYARNGNEVTISLRVTVPTGESSVPAGS